MTARGVAVQKGTCDLAEDLPGGCKLIDLKVRGDDRGSLVAIDGAADAPIAIARAYYVYGTRDGVVRGLHAHRALRQLAVSVSGACNMLLNDGRRSVQVRLDRPDQGLMLEPMVWHEMHDFSADSVLLVLADAGYDEADYIRDWDEFVRLAGA